MASLAILVEYTVKPGAITRFRELITVNAMRSLADEAGCRRFDVLAPGDEPERVVLYEIYDDNAAFDFHLTTPHYKSFAAGAEPLIETRSIRRLQFVHQTAPMSDPGEPS
jgi:(4S)-4-hydroxy-5-phosphonooxypentane-2,3-dione isomerase